MKHATLILLLALCCNPTWAQTDSALQNAANLALGKRAGAVIVINPQTGQLLALVNPKIANEQLLPPGSTLKPFMALAALRTGLIKAGSEMRCRTPYERDGYHAACLHPPNLPPFDVRQALANSCNYFFAKVGERLTMQQFRGGLAPFGLAGNLPVGKWQPRFAVGDSHEIRVRPAQLIAAYASLANGGRLYEVSNTPHLRNSIPLTAAYRRLVLEGMRGAITYGTARESGLKSLPIHVVGKTGTMLNGLGGEQGWFVGLASQTENAQAPQDFNLAVLVYLKEGKGAASAAVAEPIFAAWQGNKPQLSHTPANYLSSAIVNSPATVKVKVGLGNTPRTLPLEEYVLGVLSAEASWESEPEALKATAIAARTYALSHLRRHGRDGYDFCTLTHCQRYVPTQVATVPERLRRAVQATHGLVLIDKNGSLIEAFYSASCGGWTADAQKLWGSPPKNYLTGQRDESCVGGPHADWMDVIAAEKLAAALRSDKRADTGGELSEIQIETDETGRAQNMLLTGKSKNTGSGWDFKIIVGRALGWNYLKSSRFTVEKQDGKFIFHGHGFGHGLGLCQEGAHTRAARGASYRQILGRYFPGTTISRQQ